MPFAKYTKERLLKHEYRAHIIKLRDNKKKYIWIFQKRRYYWKDYTRL